MKLRIRRPSFFGVEPEARPLPEGTIERSFADVKAWLRNGRILRELFRHSEAELHTSSIAHVAKPFPTALLLRCLTHGPCWFSDDTGGRERIDAAALTRLGFLFLRDLVRIPLLLAGTGRHLRRLARTAKGRHTGVALAHPVLYIRTDLLFGIRSGGSVGHIAGVLNHLGSFAGAPVFVTTDRIPTVRPDIETHVITPGRDFCGFEEIPNLHFNRPFVSQTLVRLAGRAVSFVYQRYGVYGWAGVELADRLGVPLVLEYNGSEVWISRQWGRPLLHERLARRVEETVLEAADLVVVVSRPIRDELVGRGLPPERILVNPNGVDPERYAPEVDGSAVKQRLGLEGCRVLGFIGTFGRWHGAEVLADAFARLLARRGEWRSRVRLLMIGDGLMMGEVRARLTRTGALEAAVLTGTVPQSEGPAHLAACDLLVSPHVRNADGTPFFGSPTKVFEYMAMGKGIVASNLDQIGEVLRDGETALLVEPGDVDGLSSAIERLLDDDALAGRLGRAARQDVLARYTWREHTRRIVEALSTRCGGSESR